MRWGRNKKCRQAHHQGSPILIQYKCLSKLTHASRHRIHTHPSIHPLFHATDMQAPASWRSASVQYQYMYPYAIQSCKTNFLLLLSPPIFLSFPLHTRDATCNKPTQQPHPPKTPLIPSQIPLSLPRPLSIQSTTNPPPTPTPTTITRPCPALHRGTTVYNWWEAAAQSRTTGQDRAGQGWDRDSRWGAVGTWCRGGVDWYCNCRDIWGSFRLVI